VPTTTTRRRVASPCISSVSAIWFTYDNASKMIHRNC
jgi:hypothetical protein